MGTPLPTTTPAPASRLLKPTMAPLPGLVRTLSPSRTEGPSTSPTLPTTLRDMSPPSPTTAMLSTPRLFPLPTLLPTPLPLPVPLSTLLPLSMLATLLPPPSSDKLRVDQQKKTFIDMLTSILFMIFIHKSIND